jgi:katanin p80 WD40 repeat-containing subunit B1
MPLLSRTRIANNSSTPKKFHPTESADVKDIYTTTQSVSMPVAVPRDILEDKAVGSVNRGIGGRAAVPDDFRNPVHLTKLLSSGGTGDIVSSVRSMLPEPDDCSEGFSGLKFSFGLSPYDKKHDSDGKDKGDITQIAEKMDRVVSLGHPVQSNGDKCIAPFFVVLKHSNPAVFWSFC